MPAYQRPALPTGTVAGPTAPSVPPAIGQLDAEERLRRLLEGRPSTAPMARPPMPRSCGALKAADRA
ncbi:MAG: hypothetical protein U0Z44_01900 [Kouleothrix sp.]